MHGTIILAEDLDIYQMVPGTRTVARVSLFFLNIFLARYSLIVRFNERLLHTHTHTQRRRLVLFRSFAFARTEQTSSKFFGNVCSCKSK
jgi:hypothetical protein